MIELGQVFTRRIVADYMVSLFALPSKSVILDPCFGEGVFLRSLAENSDYHQIGFELDKNLFVSVSKNVCKATLHNADFLQGKISLLPDDIIMNPPYIRHEKIDELASFGITKRKLREQTIFSALPKSANLYMYFVVKAIELLKPNGELIVIFPDSWQNSKSGKSFREILSQKCSVEKKIHVSGNVFEKDALVGVVILKLRKNTSFEACETTHVCVAENGIRACEEIKQNAAPTSSKVPFGEYATIRRGLTTGYNEIFVNPSVPKNSFIKEIISSPKSVAGYCTKNADCDKLLVVDCDKSLSGQVQAYLSEWEGKIRATQKPKTLAQKISCGARWYNLNIPNCCGILFGYIVRSDMRFILNEAGKIARDNFYVITPKIDSHVLLALLNNHHTFVQLELVGRSYGGGMLKLQKYDVEKLMLPNLSTLKQEDINKLQKLGQRLAKTADKEIINEISALLAKYENVDFLAILSQYESLRSVRLEVRK